jgi:hypothetical protein
MPLDKKIRRRLANRPRTQDYAVGHGKPPLDTRFKPGQSGNPKGRPKGSGNKIGSASEIQRLNEIALKEAYRKVSVSDAKGTVKMPIAQAGLRALAVKAAKGSIRAAQLLTKIVSEIELGKRRDRDDLLANATEYKLFGEREKERCKKLGIDPPVLLPDPDYVVVNPRTGEVQIRGPATKEEKEYWDFLKDRQKAFQEELLNLNKLMGDSKYPNKDTVAEFIESTERTLGAIQDFFDNYGICKD